MIRRWRFNRRALRSTPRRKASSGSNGRASSRWLYIVDLQGDVEAEPVEGAGRLLLHRADTRAHERRDLAFGQVREVTQRDDFTLTPGQPADRVGEPETFERVRVGHRLRRGVGVVERGG